MSQESYSTPEPPADVRDQPESPADVRDLGDIPAIEVITKAIVMLMSSAAEKLGLAEGATADDVDLDEARKLITALAGLFDASRRDLGLHANPIRDGVKGLQAAFREASAYPDEPGEGPGEKLV
ncbi:hypothetical protein GOARA_063_00300 [Gordonia araii NBRC 100433]|uniref:RecA/RadA recombinase n=1 Tax=Gordonia araii NBRC 100433 TaxID=1073574 RepID=G7H4Q6_9ACTN|nr:DUF1844 domain-containing protein [Gordonia araii]NNG98028.1 hypothetical protein [Gordonia araii NBRC 100433]GAB10831.1 hypothetical protein GOARA_063_00300 [Gordonia araii NBRC 100433]